MPEYLAPGVFIEEIPARLKAIEGVSTSTAGLVGRAERGPLPGFPLPFLATNADPQPVVLVQEPTPVLVTSFAEFGRQFGRALPLPDANHVNYLAWSVKAFFDNGGKRVYIVRVAHQGDATAANNVSRSTIRIHRGVALRLRRAAAVGTNTLAFTAIRGAAVATVLSIRNRVGGAEVEQATVAAVDHGASSVTLQANLANAVDPSRHYAVVVGSLPTGDGPRFWARHPGAWSERIQVLVTQSERAAIPVTRAIADGAPAQNAHEIEVQSAGAFYRGAIVEVIHRNHSRTYHELEAVRGNVLVLVGNLGAVGVDTNSRVRIMEIDVTLADETAVQPLVEVFRGLTWNPRSLPDLRRRHYSTVVNAQSRLCFVQPPGVGGMDGSEDATLASMPTTWNGFAVSPREINGLQVDHEALLAPARTAVGSVVAAVIAIQGAGVFPPAGPAVLAANAAEADATAAAAALAAAAANTPALATSLTAAADAANDAAAAAADAAAIAAGATAAAEALAARTVAETAAAAFGSALPATLGADGNVPDDADFVGVNNGPGSRTGIDSLADNDEIRIIAAPGRTAAAVQLALLAQAERLRYRFVVLDGERDPAGGSVDAILAHRNLYDSSFGAYYAPWVEITVGEDRIQLPSSGFVIGVYARTDVERGVWKAPANEVVRTATGLRAYITTGEQEVLNPRGVNCIRRFEGRGIRIWGARTLSSDPEFKYVNVRRFLIFMEASIDRGTQWVVFEPNTPDTWGRVADSVSAFLHTQWRSGALFGRKPEDAFFVRCDETTMTADDVQNGRLICNIGVAIVRPAEFVIFRIEQITGFAKK